MMSENTELWRRPIIQLPFCQAFPEQGESKRFEHKKVVMSEDKEVLYGVVSKKKLVLPHIMLTDAVDKAVRDLYKEEVNADLVSMKDGAQIRVKYDLPREAPIVLRGDDVINPMLFLYNSYDQGLPMKIRVGLYRQVCSNGAVVGDTISCLKGQDIMEGISENSLSDRIKKMLDDARKTATVWSSWQNTLVPFEIAEQALGKKFPIPVLGKVLIEDEYPIDMYSLYNMLTRIATHETRSLRAQITFDSIIASVFYSPRSPFRQLDREAMKQIAGTEEAAESTEALPIQ